MIIYKGEKYVLMFKVKNQNPGWCETLKVLHKNLPKYFPNIKPVKNQVDTWSIQSPIPLTITKTNDEWTFTILDSRMNTSDFDKVINFSLLIRFLNTFTGNPRNREQNIFWISGFPFKFEIDAFCHKYAKDGHLTDLQFREILKELSIKGIDGYVTKNREYLEPEELKYKIERVFLDQRTTELPIEEIAQHLKIDSNELAEYFSSNKFPGWLVFGEETVICSSKRLEKRIGK